MKERLRTIVRPESARQSTRAPQAREAIAMWFIGTAWAATCVGMWQLGVRELVPVSLLGAMLTLSAWRRRAWLHWFPAAAVVATLLDVAAPVHPRPGVLAPRYVELVGAGAVLLLLARRIASASETALHARREGARIVAALLTAGALAAIGTHARAIVAAVVACGVASALARRSASVRSLWMAFPVAAGLVGLHAVVAMLRGGAPGLAAETRAADAVWAHGGGLLELLIVALPASVGLVFDRAPRLRAFAAVATALGLVGLALHATHGAWADRTPAVTMTRALWAGCALAALAIAAVARPGQLAGSRWAGLGATLLAAATCILVSRTLTAGTAIVLVGMAIGLLFGSLGRARSRRRPAHVPLQLVVATSGEPSAESRRTLPGSRPPLRRERDRDRER